jgi:anti-anti-sigma regulatory factor
MNGASTNAMTSGMSSAARRAEGGANLTGLSTDTMFTLSRVGDSAVVSLCCSKIEESQCNGLHSYLLGLARNSGGRLALELAGVRNFSCAWINAMMELTRECRALGGQLVLFGLRTEHQTILERTGLVRQLVVASSRTRALELLGSATIAPWRLAIARLLDIPVALPFEEPVRTGHLARAA